MIAGYGPSKPAKWETAAVETRRVADTRYGESYDIAQAVGAFVGLFFLAA